MHRVAIVKTEPEQRFGVFEMALRIDDWPLASPSSVSSSSPPPSSSSSCTPLEVDFFRLTRDVVRDERDLKELEKLLNVDAWTIKKNGEDLTYEDGRQSERFQCKSMKIFNKVKPLLMPYWLEMMPNFDLANLLG